MQKHFDAIVIGLGAMGSAAFYHLARTGKSVLGLDRFEPPHANGSSHGDTRIIRRTSYSPEIYVPLANRAFELWEQLERDSKAELLRVTGGLMIGGPDSAVINRCRDCQKNWGVEGELLSSADMHHRFSQFALPENHLAFLEHGAGYLLLDECIRSHCSGGRAAGGVAHVNESALSWSAAGNDEGVVVRTDKNTYTADALVIAAGPWSVPLLSDLDLRMKTERQILHWFEPAGSRSKFESPQFPIYIWYLDSGLILYGFPHVAGRRTGVKLAVESENQFCTPESVDRTVSDAETARVRNILAEFIPELAGECTGTATCMYSPTEDNHFIISLHPRHQQVVVLAGFLGAGFKFASAVGEAAKDLVIDRTSTVVPDGLRADRFGSNPTNEEKH